MRARPSFVCFGVSPSCCNRACCSVQVAIQSAFDGLTKLLSKSAQLVATEGIPPFYLKALVDLEEVRMLACLLADPNAESTSVYDVCIAGGGQG